LRKFSISMAFLILLGFFISTASYAEDTYGHIVDPYREYSYEDMLRDAAALRDMYPDLIRLGSIGRSVEGRELLLIEFGSGGRKIFVNGAVHASEYICSSYLMYMVEQYACAYETSGFFGDFDVREILGKVTLCIVPMVNPDGINLVQNGVGAVLEPGALSKIAANDPRFVDYSCWKANIDGVDLNRNFDDNWYVARPVKAPAAKLFKGDYPLSEPETRAVVSYVNKNMFWAFLNFHSQGGGVYGWDDRNARYYPELGSMLSRIIDASGFKKLKDTSETDYGTFAGYARATFLKPALTVELCRYVSSYPYPNEDFLSVWTPARDFCLIVAEEVVKMQPQQFLVIQNGTLLQAFCDESYACAYASGYPGSVVIYAEGGSDGLAQCQPAEVTVSVNGNGITFQAYNISGSNYLKLRDLAMALSGTTRQFAVGYDGTANAVTLKSGAPYEPVGGELTYKSGSAPVLAVPSRSAIYLDGRALDLTVYNIGGSNYFRLRDLGKAMDFAVTWDGTGKTVSIDTSDSYSE
jgi:hypothetical protein